MYNAARAVDFGASRNRSARRALFLDLAGPLCLSNADGNDLTPKSPKAQGLLALIATSPCLRRSRIWLQDKLWSDCSPERSAACLRQCLLRVRLSLGEEADCLKTEKGWIAFDSGRVSVRTEQLKPHLGGQIEFLEGLDVRDPEFEDWLREQRMFYWERWNNGTAEFLEEKTGASHSASARHSGCRAPFAGPLQPTFGVATQHNPQRDHAADALRRELVRLVAQASLGRAADLTEPDQPTNGAISALADAAADPALFLSKPLEEAARCVLEALCTFFQTYEVVSSDPDRKPESFVSSRLERRLIEASPTAWRRKVRS
ncbi:MAG: hypothetical protein H0T41_15765 [Rhodobacteraceae bacterium]|nr:hypothetical protein [Paracoccaceae bacterium]